MIVSLVTREQFLRLLASHEVARTESVADVVELARMLRDDDRLACVWEEGANAGAALPAAISVPNGQVRDFLAWCVTYLEGYGPLTALCRVVERNDLSLDQFPFLAPALPELDGACVGAVIGEAWTLYTLAGRPVVPSLSSCLSTYSFVAARLLALKRPHGLQERLVNEWSRALRLTGQPPREISAVELEGPWGVLRSLASGDPVPEKHDRSLLYLACQQLMKKQEVQPELLEEICGRDVQVVWKGTNGTREERVLRLKNFTQQATNWGTSYQERASFLLGYLASRIAPGSLEHIGLLQPAVRQQKTSVVWYGICAGLSGRTALLSDGRGLGWRVLRELLRWERLEERPRADVAVEELELLTAQKIKVRAMGNFIQVELVPFCAASFKRHDAAQRTGAEQAELFLRRAETPKEVIDNLKRALHEAAVALAAMDPDNERLGRKRKRSRRATS